MSEIKLGLEGVVVAQTEISKVFGKEGKLIYRGFDINDLARNSNYEEVAYLLLHGQLPTRQELDQFSQKLSNLRDLPNIIRIILEELPPNAVPMAVLRTSVSALGLIDPDADLKDASSNLRKAYSLVAKIPTIVATFDRYRKGKEIIPPRTDLGHAENFLYMLHGELPAPEATKALDTYLVVMADHGFNASTFSCRVTAATLSDTYSAVTSGIGTLKGPSHGGATQASMEEFMEIGDVSNVKNWFKNTRETNRRIMGMGHRVYKVEDPRAKYLREVVRAMATNGGRSKWFAIAEALEQEAEQDPFFIQHGIYINADFYSAILLYSLGIDPDLFAPMFSIARIAGWSSHLIEQYADNRLIRPMSHYAGPMDQKWVPIDER